MGDTATIRALVVTHGELGKELVRVAELVIGLVPDLGWLSNQGRSAQDLTARIEAWLADPDGAPPAGNLLMIDDYGGSCANAARLAARPPCRVAIISGVNLAMLLGFASWRDSLPLGELSRKLVELGREAITRVEPVGGE